MAFDGLDKLKQDAKGTGGGRGWLRLVDDTPSTVTVLGYEGLFKSPKFDSERHRFLVQDDQGQEKYLEGGWRLKNLLHDLAEKHKDPFTVTITQKKSIVEIKDPKSGAKRKVAANVYTVEDVAPF